MAEKLLLPSAIRLQSSKYKFKHLKGLVRFGLTFGLLTNPYLQHFLIVLTGIKDSSTRGRGLASELGDLAKKRDAKVNPLKGQVVVDRVLIEIVGAVGG